jgi:response regulator RpfG family c-di-GMP phosphodiesterase
MTTPSPSTAARPRVLCLDDEAAILESLTLTLRRPFEVVTAQRGEEALQKLEQPGPFAVIISDMRMPGMNGAEFLARARALQPDATRLLLTGYSDTTAAISAVNDGQIFRFLTKPCPPPQLLAVVQAAAEQHRLVTAERTLLTQTLHGCIAALSDILALAKPESFGRAARIKSLVAVLAARLGMKQVWHLEVAAMLSQLANVTLPDDLARKLYDGSVLSNAEQSMVDGLPDITTRLLGHIPRLEPVRDILASALPAGSALAASAPDTDVLLGRSVLRVAVAFDRLTTGGVVPEAALGTLRKDEKSFDPRVVEALAEEQGASASATMLVELSAQQLLPGMVFADDLCTARGALLLARGNTVTESVISRLHYLPPGSLREPLRMIVPATRPC